MVQREMEPDVAPTRTLAAGKTEDGGAPAMISRVRVSRRPVEPFKGRGNAGTADPTLYRRDGTEATSAQHLETASAPGGAQTSASTLHLLC